MCVSTEAVGPLGHGVPTPSGGAYAPYPWTECGDDLVIAEPSRKRSERDGKFAGIDAETGNHATWTNDCEGVFKGLCGAEGLDGYINAASSCQFDYRVGHICTAIRFDISIRIGSDSTAITKPAPLRRAPTVAHKPIGP